MSQAIADLARRVKNLEELLAFVSGGAPLKVFISETQPDPSAVLPGVLNLWWHVGETVPTEALYYHNTQFGWKALDLWQ